MAWYNTVICQTNQKDTEYSGTRYLKAWTHMLLCRLRCEGGAWGARSASVIRLNHMTSFSALTLSHSLTLFVCLMLKMTEEREPPPLHNASHTDFTELEDGEDLFVSTVSLIEVRDDHSPSADSLLTQTNSAHISVHTHLHVTYGFGFCPGTFHSIWQND